MSLAAAVSGVLTAVLAGLSLLHVRWAWGGLGESRSSVVLPEVAGQPALRPTRTATLAVALALALAAWIAAAQGALLRPGPGGWARWGAIGCSAVFAAR